VREIVYQLKGLFLKCLDSLFGRVEGPGRYAGMSTGKRDKSPERAGGMG